MTILFFSRLFDPHIGGVEKHVMEISKQMVKDGHTVIVVTENHSWSPMESKEGIQIYRMSVGEDEWLKKFRIWSWLWNHKLLMQNADLIHCHDVFFWYLPFRFLFLNKPVYTTFHGYEGNNLPSKKAIFMHKVAEKLSFGNICVGEFLEKWYGTKATYVTYGAVDETENREQRTKNYKKTVFIGRLEEETGILEYLKAIALLKKQKIDTHLTVIGDGSQRKESERWAKEDRLDVRFLGFQKNVNKYILDADIIFTSRYLGILEAMAFQKPVFTVYNNQIKKDYLSMTPFTNFINTAKDADEIAEEFLSSMQQKKNTEKKVKEGYEWARKQTWEKLTTLYLRLWKSSK